MTADQVPNVLVLNTPPAPPPTELGSATDVICVGGGVGGYLSASL